MSNAEKDLNPFHNAKTEQEREAVWKSLRKISKPVPKEEAEQLTKEAIRLQKAVK